MASDRLPLAEVVVFRAERLEEAERVATALARAGVPCERRPHARVQRLGPWPQWLIVVPPTAADRARALLDGEPITTPRVLAFRRRRRPIPTRRVLAAIGLGLLLAALVVPALLLLRLV